MMKLIYENNIETYKELGESVLPCIEYATVYGGVIKNYNHSLLKIEASSSEISSILFANMLWNLKNHGNVCPEIWTES